MVFAAAIVAAQQRESFDIVSIRRNTAAVNAGPRGGGQGGGSTRQDPCSDGRDLSIDPTRFDATNATVIQLISWAYGMNCVTFRGVDLVSGGPDWLKSEGYDLQTVRPDGPSDYTNRREGRGGTF